MLREKLEEWLLSKGYEKDRFGHFHKTRTNGQEIRYKMNTYSCRYEVRSGFGWVRVYSGYYKNLSITDDNRLSGLTR